MSKVLYIIGIVFAVIFIGVCGYYAEEVSDARLDYLFSSYNYSYSSYSSYSYIGSASDITVEAGVWSLVFILFFIAMNLVGLIKVKTKTSKVLTIIGLSFSGILLFWDFAMIASPGSISFDEVSPAWVFFILMMLAFSIVGLIQSIRFSKKELQMRTSSSSVSTESKDLLDS